MYVVVFCVVPQTGPGCPLVRKSRLDDYAPIRGRYFSCVDLTYVHAVLFTACLWQIREPGRRGRVPVAFVQQRGSDVRDRDQSGSVDRHGGHGVFGRGFASTVIYGKTVTITATATATTTRERTDEKSPARLIPLLLMLLLLPTSCRRPAPYPAPVLLALALLLYYYSYTLDILSRYCYSLLSLVKYAATQLYKIYAHDPIAHVKCYTHRHFVVIHILVWFILF